ncbi:nitroreductase family protein [Croceitalea rosinachiae]|uniref:Nitroreductase family protein n=1 Tax=Croceitalea rosinachiae TaxID=3075596 RepID=A0ABU3A7U1_9FLAO|nr:nitroreductase family protein [Croceitalea sp. F388]MDT0606247.1 nitroreductase family protein [Croceitalea sp. F388]
MNVIWRKIRPLIRGGYRIFNGFNGFMYDFKRFLFYGGWVENLSDKETRNYNSVMAYHGLEKSLSYKKRNPTSGWKNAERVFARLKIANSIGEYGYHDKAAKQVLQKFLDLPPNKDLAKSKEMRLAMNKMDFESKEEHGALVYPETSFRKGILNKPEDFFFSRYSLREFNGKVVSDEYVNRAIRLAMKTPSVCNRQAWHIFHTSDKDTIQKALHYQNGNKPFGVNAPNLLIISTDLKAFFAGAEHYQHWIEGGLISMSIMYALHSLGIASCPLNWSQTPKMDKALRKVVNIKPNQTVIMMMMVGYPDDVNKVCSSTRRPLDEVLSKLELK